ncbi:TIGR04211 family SH3 domain-containing protein [Thalassomonas viridans]|uniref:TIGR04211 family SH3 domain-containing protein n=1 Tax=Thalassomonas viridans TaxID=137584 RepID=A0AAE9Z1C7_9GAMM|nr:TIGR04211 family SH3 domain-containing protein [Thalassomonas viridans]WDE04235.1 TIGR04211 family SH3 domain-containing protein [Thalassomonas viridans]
MKRVSCLLISVLFGLSFPVFAQENAAQEEIASEATPGFISDELIIYMHAGAGNNFRILGSVTAGAEVSLTGQENNNYTQIIDARNRTAWVESKYVSSKPGLRFVIAELNEQLTSAADENSQLKQQLDDSETNITSLNDKNQALQDETAQLQQQLATVQQQLKSQDQDIKKEWFINGAIVLGFGLLLGLIIPKLFGGRSNKMDRWT